MGNYVLPILVFVLLLGYGTSFFYHLIKFGNIIGFLSPGSFQLIEARDHFLRCSFSFLMDCVVIKARPSLSLNFRFSSEERPASVQTTNLESAKSDNKNDIILFAYDIKYSKPFLEMLFDYKLYLNEFAFSIKQKYYYQNNVFDEIKIHKSIKSDLINTYSNQKIGTYCFDKEESEHIMISFDFLKSEIDLQSDYRIAIFLLDDNINYNNLENILGIYNIIIFQFNFINNIKECVLNNKPIDYDFVHNLEMTNFKIKIPINILLTSFDSHKKLVYRLFVSKRFEDKQFRMIVKNLIYLIMIAHLG